MDPFSLHFSDGNKKNTFKLLNNDTDFKTLAVNWEVFWDAVDAVYQLDEKKIISKKLI